MSGVGQASDEIWDQYLSRMGGREMYRTEPYFRAQMQLTRQFMRLLGLVLEDELRAEARKLADLGILDWQVQFLIERILRGFLYGTSPGISDAQHRIAMQRQMVDLVETRPLSFLVTPGANPPVPEKGGDSGR